MFTEKDVVTLSTSIALLSKALAELRTIDNDEYLFDTRNCVEESIVRCLDCIQSYVTNEEDDVAAH